VITLDTTTVGTILGFIGTISAIVAGVYTATRNRETEKKDAALQTLEETRDEAYEARVTLLEQKLAFKDDIINRDKAFYERSLHDKELQIEDLNIELTNALKTIKELKGV
jgi:uncharacterized coiled-coil protein SlyX